VLVVPLALLFLSTGFHGQPAPENRPAPRPQSSRAVDDPRCKPAQTSFECATLLVQNGDFQPAISLLGRALSSTPRDLKTLNLLGIALTGAGRTDDANRRFRQALAIDPSFYPAKKNLAVNEFNAGRDGEAEDLFKEVLGVVPDDEIAHLHLGEIHFARKQLAAALAHFEKSGARATANPAWTLHFASCLLEQGQVPRAVALLDRLPAGDATSRFEAGMLLGSARIYSDAARQFGVARAGYKDPYAAGYNQMLMLVEAGEHERAIDVAQELFRANQRTGELYNLVSRAYIGANRIQDAYDALRTAARLEPSEEQHYLDLSLLCLDHENFDLGMEIVDVGLKYKPESGRLHVYRGVLLVMKGVVDEAEREFETARRLGPGGPAPDVALAMAWMQSGNAGRAVDLLREGTKAGAREAVVPYMLGIALMRTGIDAAAPEGAEAIAAFEAAIKLDPTLAGPRTELGKALLRRGDTQKAIEQLELAATLDPDNPAALYLLGQAHRKMGNTARAQELLARVTKLNEQGRSEDPDKELKRIVVRIVREGAAPPARR
jgi:tetratricopeptide (TPR) repeat protein